MPGLPAEISSARATVADLRAQRAELISQLRQAEPGSDDRQALLTQYRSVGDQLVSVAGSAISVLGNDLVADAEFPLTLLPVRAETRYSMDGGTLRIRIYPDDVHTLGLDDGVDESEQAAAQQYWTARWDNAAAGRAEDPQNTLWQAFTLSVGANRAAWIAFSLTPTNLADFGQATSTPTFPTGLAPRHNRPAVALALPDRFHALALHPDGSTSQAHGSTVPDELAVSMPSADTMTALSEDGQPVVDAEMRWLTDYNTALSVGMAVELPLPMPFAPVQRLLVLGVRSTLPTEDGSQLLDRLLVGHRFADAAEFVPVGTPTNNTESDRSGWTLRTVAGPPASTETSLPDWSNAQVLGSALGMDPAHLATLPRAAEIDSGRIHALHLLLWDSTWGEFLNRTAQPGAVGPALRASLQDHFVQRVRSRGPLPPVRIGKQPYGVLPILNTSALTPDSSPIESVLAPFLQRLRAVWGLGLPDVPTMREPTDVDDALSEILGTAPVLRGVMLRTIASAAASATVLGASPDSAANAAVQAQVSEVGYLLAGIENGYRPTENDLLGKADRTLALPLANDDDVEFIKALLDPGATPPAPTSILQVLLAHACQYADHDLAQFGSREDLSSISGIALEQAASQAQDIVGSVRAAMASLAQQSRPDPGVLSAAADALSAQGLLLDRSMLAVQDPFPALSAPTVTAVGRLTAGGASTAPLQRDSTALRLVSETIRLHLRRAAFDDALEIILQTTTDERSLMLAEVLDACSHRLDAWLTSIATHRLERMRAANPSGTTLGAYAWLEDIEPAHPQPSDPPDQGVTGVILTERQDGGFIQAPSMSHATTAAILRSGQLSHGAADPDSPRLAVDLESARVRQALQVLSGVRSGQPLGALLGYRFERTLLSAEPSLARFVYALRPLAPLVAGKLSDVGAVSEAVAITNVVDGVKLRELSLDHPEQIDNALTQGPHELGSPDGRYLITWDAPSAAERNGVWAALKALDDQYDALADLLLSESVHQLVKGNPSRSAAAMDALGGGESVPPEPDVIRTPRSGLALTHRVGVLLPAAPVNPGATGWSPVAPRAVAEPALEAWVAAQLGPPPLGTEQPGTNTAGLCALDVLYDADGDDYQATSLVRRLPGLDETQWQLIRSLRTLVTNARPVTLDWLGRTLADGESPDDGGLLDRADIALDSLSAAVSIVQSMGPAAALEDVLSQLEPFGLRAGPVLPTDLVAQHGVIAGLLADGGRRVQGAFDLLTEGRAAEALSSIFGAGFLALPIFGMHLLPKAAEPMASAGALQPGRDVRPWLSRSSSVRPACARYAETLLFREALGGSAIGLQVSQSQPSTPRWIGLPFDPTADWPQTATTSWVFEAAPEAELTGAVTGFVIDEWSEAVPRHIPDPTSGANRLVNENGIAINANGPDARPPQAILLALSADGQPWNVERLAATLDDTRAMLRERLVTLEKVPFAGRVLPALYFKDWALQGEPIIDFAKLSVKFTSSAAITFLKGV